MTNDEFTSVHMATEDFEEMKNACIVEVLKDVKAEIEDIDGITEIGAQILDEVLGIIEQKIAEVTKNE